MTSFSWLALLQMSGSVLGTLAGFLWVGILPLTTFSIFCAGSACFSFILAFYLISEPAVHPETVQLGSLTAGLSRTYHRLVFKSRHLFIKAFSPSNVAKQFRASRSAAMTGRLFLLLSAFVIYAGNSVISTPFTPFLASRGVLDNEVFAVYSINILLQMVVYRWVGSFIEVPGKMKSVLEVILLRPLLMVILASSALLYSGDLLFGIVSVFFGILGATFAIWNSATSVALYSSLGESRQGSILGWYTAIVYLGVVVGSLFSGYLASYLGYPTTFTIGAVLTLLTFFIQKVALRNLGYIDIPSHK